MPLNCDCPIIFVQLLCRQWLGDSPIPGAHNLRNRNFGTSEQIGFFHLKLHTINVSTSSSCNNTAAYITRVLLWDEFEVVDIKNS
jgi:hypothetical protein